MAGTATDYESLLRNTGGSIDWDTVVQRHGGSIRASTPNSTPDYGAIASRHGATLSDEPPEMDLDALVAKHGGQVQPTPTARRRNEGKGKPPAGSVPEASFSELLGVPPIFTEGAKFYAPVYEPVLKRLPEPVARTAKEVGKATLQFGEGMVLSPLNAGIMTATGGLGMFASKPAAAALGKAISAGFSVDMLMNAAERSPEFAAAWEAGKYPEAIGIATSIGLETLVAGAAARHAAAGVRATPTGFVAEAEPMRATAAPKTPADLEMERIFALDNVTLAAEPRSAIVNREIATRQQAGNWDIPEPQQPRANRAQRRASAMPPEEGIPNEAQLDAQERIAQQLVSQPYERLSETDRRVVDELVAEGRIGEEPKPRELSEPEAPTINAAPAEVAAEIPPTVEKRAPLEPREPAATPVYGRETEIRIPGERKRYKAVFTLREAEDVYPSHNPFNFERNEAYQHVNDRNYSEPQAAERIVKQTGEFDPAYLVNDNPTAEQGPPIIDANGNVLGGNSRAMTMARVEQQNPEGMQAYREMVTKQAKKFGLDSELASRMKRPVLVRQIVEDLTDAQAAITDFNKVGTAELRQAERAIADSRRVTARTLDEITTRIEQQGPEATLTQALAGDARPIVERMVEDGVITNQEKPRILNQDGSLTAEGKARVSRLMIGRLFEDARQFDDTPADLRGKLERIVAPLTRTEGVEGWDLTGATKEAVSLIEEARRRDLNIDDLVEQRGMFGPTEYSESAIAIARKLQEKPTDAARAFRQYAAEAELGSGKQQLMGMDAPKAEESFRAAFGDKAEGVNAYRSEEPLYTRSLEDIQAAEREAQGRDKADLIELFGEDGAKRYSSLQQRANSTLRSHQDTDAAYAEIAQMEGSLTEQQRNRLFGIGDERPQLDEIRDYRQALERVDLSSPKALGESLKWAITKIGAERSPEQMNHSQQVALAQLRYGMEQARELGYDTRVVTDTALEGAAARFRAEDVETMLGHFRDRGAGRPQLNAARFPSLPESAREWRGGRSNYALSKDLAYQPIELEERFAKLSDAIVMSPAGMELIGRAGGSGFDATGPRVAGLHVSAGDVARLARNLERIARDPDPDFQGPHYAQPLVEILNRAAGQKKSVILISDLPAFERYRETALLEEQHHAMQADISEAKSTRGHFDGVFWSFVRHPVFEKARSTLVDMRGYGQYDAPTQALEVAVRLMRKSGFQELGLRASEARSLAAQYVRTLRKKYGSTAPREIAREVFGALRDERRGTQPVQGDQRLRSSGRSGPPEGTGPPVSEYRPPQDQVHEEQLRDPAAREPGRRENRLKAAQISEGGAGAKPPETATAVSPEPAPGGRKGAPATTGTPTQPPQGPTTSPSYETTKPNILKNVSEQTRSAMETTLQDFEARNPERKVVNFADIQREAHDLDPKIVAQLDIKNMKAGETLDPAVRFAARETLNGINRELEERRGQMADSKVTDRMTPEQIADEARKIEALEQDARRLVDVLIPTRSQDGRNLAYHRMMAEGSFDVTYWLSRARRAMALPEGAALPEQTLKDIQQITARGEEATANAIQRTRAPQRQTTRAEAERQAREELGPLPDKRDRRTVDEQGNKLPTLEERQARYRQRVLELIDQKMRGEKRDIPKSKWELTPEERAQVDRDPAVKSARIELARKLSTLEKTGWLDTVLAVRAAGLLTGLKTHGRNLGGNTAFQVLEELQRVPSAVVDSAFTLFGKERSITGPSLRAMKNAGKSAATRGVKEALQILKEGAAQEDLAKLDYRKEVNSGNKVLDKAVNFVFRTLAAEDRIFKVYAYERSLAERMKLAKVAEPTDTTRIEAANDALFATFNNQNLIADRWSRAKGELRATDNVGAKALSAAMDLAVPFVRTPANIVARVIDYTPVGGTARAGAEVYKAIKAKGFTPEMQRAFSQAIGRGATGSALLWLGWWMGEQGLMTGIQEQEKGLRDMSEAAGRMYGSVKIGDTWQRIDSLSPVGNMLVLGATLQREGVKKDDLSAIAIAGGKTVMEQPMLQGLSQASEAIADPARSASRFVASAAGSFIPTAVADAAALTDDVRRDASGDGLTDSVGNAIAARVPGLRQTLPPRRDIFGEDLKQEWSAAINPGIGSKAKENDPVIKALIENRVPVSFSQRKTGETEDEFRARRAGSPGAKRKVAETEQQYGARLKREGSAIRSRLLIVINSRKFKEADQDERREMMKAEISKVRARVD